jgi:hypothetical protein
MKCESGRATEVWGGFVEWKKLSEVFGVLSGPPLSDEFSVSVRPPRLAENGAAMKCSNSVRSVFLLKDFGLWTLGEIKSCFGYRMAQIYNAQSVLGE